MKKYVLNLNYKSDKKSVELLLVNNDKFFPINNVKTYTVLDIENEDEKINYSIQEVDSNLHIIEVFKEKKDGKFHTIISSSKELDMDMKVKIFKHFDTGDGTEMIFQNLFVANQVSDLKYEVSDLKYDEAFSSFVNIFLDEIDEFFKKSFFTKFKNFFRF